ncbi:hypothetical protein BX666DRAFT_1893983 [Dichotomocladium elegans]|nr:hypothetical protein BX666DRAFT_1893983 [Dichotomocladium elegans]
MYSRAEAACKAFGMPMSQENGDYCLDILDQGGLDVVYVEELGDKRPIIMGKEAIIRDTITYMKYVGVPTPSTIHGKATAIAPPSKSSCAPTPGVSEVSQRRRQ